MKKQYYIFTLIMVAMAMLIVGCQKEESVTVTLGAKIQEPIREGSKAYIDGYTPCWHNGDKVYINNTAYPVMAASGSSAQIENVTANSSYRAVFPAGIITPGTNINANSSIPVTLPAVQRYEQVGGHQRVDVPMGAYLTSGSTLQFFNLCSVVRVTVSNSMNRELPLRHIAMKTGTAMLSGAGTATVVGTVSTAGGSESANHIEMSGSASHSVCLGFTSDNPVTVPALGSKTFDIVVPAFTTDNVTFTLYTTDGYYFEMTKPNKALAQNTITTVTMNVTGLTQIVAAELVNGNTFKSNIPSTATSIVFECNNNTITSGIPLSIDNSIPIYGNLEGSTWHVSTAANIINANPDCRNMFLSKNNIASIDFGEGFNTSNVTDMSWMFDGCSGLTCLDVSHFNTSNVTNMQFMFYECSSLPCLDLSNFSTSNVTDMRAMFEYCRSLTKLELSSFSTSNVTNMSYMFQGCGNLTSLDLSSFNTSSVTNMKEMFEYCGVLTSLDISNFNTLNVTDMSNMFHLCRNLTSLDLSGFHTSQVTSMAYMFAECGVTSLNLSSFNTSNVTDMTHMFYSCSSLTSLNLSNFNTSNVTNMGHMFCLCYSLTSIDISNFNTSFVTNMRKMFSTCDNLTSLNLSNFNTSSVTDMRGMFAYCHYLTSLDLSNFDMNHLGFTEDGITYNGKESMCENLSIFSEYCTITCPEAAEIAIKEVDPNYNSSNPEHPHYYYYYTGLPTSESGVTFTWVRPSSSK